MMMQNTNLAEDIRDTETGSYSGEIISLPMTNITTKWESNYTKPEDLNGFPRLDKAMLTQKVEAYISNYEGNFMFSDLFNGRLFASVFEGKLLFCEEKRTWMAYNGIWWIEDADNYVETCVMELADAIGEFVCERVKDEKNPVYKGAAKWQKRKTQNDVIHFASALMTISVRQFDANPQLLNVRNGTIELLENEYKFREHRAEDLIIKCANVDYSPHANCNEFREFCNSIMPTSPSQKIQGSDVVDETNERVKYLQRMVGYCLSGKANEQCFFILYGDGRNGKGVFVHAINKVLGSYAGTTMPSTFAKGQSASAGSASGNVARLAGLRFISVPEPEKGTKLNEALIKAATGQDLITARFLYNNDFEFRLEGKIVMSTNYLPEIEDKRTLDTGRIIPIHFERNFAEHEQNKGLKERLVTEASKSAILKWALDGYRMQCTQSVKVLPISIQRTLDAYKMKTINAAKFIAEKMERIPAGSIPCTTDEAYSAYREWCEDNQFRSESQAAFNVEVQKVAKVERKKLNGLSRNKYIIGMGLKT